MGIKDLQIKQAINEVLSRELKAGLNPTQESMTYLLAEYFKDHPPGTPSLKVIPAVYRGQSNADNYNSMLDAIDIDLHILYEALLEQNKTIINNFVLYENERIAISNKIDQLSEAVHNVILEAGNTNPYVFSLSEDFSSLKNIDIKNTTALVDLKDKKTTLPLLEKGIEKIALKNAKIVVNQISPEDQIQEQKELSPLENCLDDFLNTAWNYQVKVSEKNKENVSVELKITLPEKTMISQLELIPNSPHETFIEVSYSDEKNNWNKLDLSNKSNILLQKKKWNFNPVWIKEMIIKLTKNNPDMEDNQTYIFGLKNISLSYIQYTSEAILVTKPLELKPKNKIEDFTVEKIMLETDDFIPSNTSIDYFIQYTYEGSNNFSTQIPISPTNHKNPKYSQVISLNNIERVNQTFIANDLQLGNTCYGIQFYQYDGLLEKPIAHQIKLYRGINLWEKQYFDYKYPENHEVSLKDWNNLPVLQGNIHTEYVTSITKDSILNRNYKFTKWVYCPKEQNIATNLIDYPSANYHKDGRDTALYVNNKKLNKIKDGNKYKYHIHLKKGWNKIIFLAYVIYETQPFTIGFDMTDIQYTKHRAHKEPMNEVSIYELQNNILATETNYFAVDYNGNIVLNNNDYNQYDVVYNYTINKVDRLMLTAKLNKNDGHLSPVINKFRLNLFY